MSAREQRAVFAIAASIWLVTVLILELLLLTNADD